VTETIGERGVEANVHVDHRVVPWWRCAEGQVDELVEGDVVEPSGWVAVDRVEKIGLVGESMQLDGKGLGRGLGVARQPHQDDTCVLVDDDAEGPEVWVDGEVRDAQSQGLGSCAAVVGPSSSDEGLVPAVAGQAGESDDDGSGRGGSVVGEEGVKEGLVEGVDVGEGDNGRGEDGADEDAVLGVAGLLDGEAEELGGLVEVVAHGAHGAAGVVGELLVGERLALGEGLVESLEDGGGDGSSCGGPHGAMLHGWAGFRKGKME
jgi:hypothetical protein